NRRALLRDAGIDEQQPTTDSAENASSRRTAPTRDEVQCQNNLRQIGLALHNYHDAYGNFPPQASFDKSGKPLLSWRVHILPFLEQEELDREFHLDEPWDSDHNKKLIDRMPPIYRCPKQKLKESGKTTYLAPVGEKAIFSGGQKGMRLSDVIDGTSNTML